VARGARGPKAKLRGSLQLFALLEVGLTGRGELKTLTHADLVAPSPSLNAERVLYGWYLNELLLRLLAREDPHPVLFAAYARAIEALIGEEADAALRRFEWTLLHELGFGLAALPDHEEGHWAWTPGGEWQAASPEHGVATSTLAALTNEAVTMSALQCIEARRLLKPMLEQALGGRPLATSRLMREFRARARSA
jgi:DNA repair protein RecO (recombination protein O)